MKKRRRLGEAQLKMYRALDEFCNDHEQIKAHSAKVACLIGGKFMVDLAIRKSPSLARRRQ